MRIVNRYILIACLAAITGTSCEKFLDREPESKPTSGTFFVTQKEMEAGLMGVYQSLYWNAGNAVPYQVTFDHWTDIGVERGEGLAAGNFDTNNGDVANIWKNCYTMIQRANTLLAGMEKGRGNVPADAYARIAAEARALRAWAYHYLVFMYGDVPLVTHPLAPEEYYPARTPKNEVLDFIYKELDSSAAGLQWVGAAERGRLTKAFVFGLKARTALYAGNYALAASSADSVIQKGGLDLNPTFANLFTLSGQKTNAGKEIMLELLFSDAVASSFNYLALGQGSRNLGGQSGKFPTQRLVDLFECTDGKRIDESPLYDPANPYKNRDPRMRWTVMTNGDTITQYGVGNAPRRCVFNVYDAKTQFYNFSNNTWAPGDNLDVSNAYGPVLNGVGYLWAKYTFTDEYIVTARVSWIFMRYAEILLTYAEAKTELGQLDASVTAAVNKVRRRAGLPDVDAAVAADPQKMRQLLRRERTVELALEGFRWFDIRRWKIAELVMPGKVYGATRKKDAPAPLPDFRKSAITDLNNIPDYSNGADKRFQRDNRTFTSKHYLFPVPQRERDLNATLTQNPGWQ